MNQNQNIIQNNQNFNQMNRDMNLVSQIYNNKINVNINNFWININQISLLIVSIDFCHNNENEFMNINDKYWIMNIMNRLNPNLSAIKKDNEILDPLYYIEESKKVIKFVNSYFKLFNISKDCIIEEDESSVDSISEGDLIIIIDNRIYPDYSYYKSLLI